MGGNKNQMTDEKDLNHEQDQDETVQNTPQDSELEDDWENPTQGELGGETPDLYEDEEDTTVTPTTQVDTDNEGSVI